MISDSMADVEMRFDGMLQCCNLCSIIRLIGYMGLMLMLYALLNSRAASAYREG